MSARRLVEGLADIRLSNVFNPYSDRCSTYDRPDAPRLRRRALRTYLEAVRLSSADTVWMGRDLGYKGGRRTGLALTDEHHLQKLSTLYPGVVWPRATYGPASLERTATEIWKCLVVLPSAPLLWNVFPLHPHEFDEPFTNRKFSAKELDAVQALNLELFAWLGIRHIVALGQDAAKYALTFGLPVDHVRHPSYGGVIEFRAAIRALYHLPQPQADLFGSPSHRAE